MADMTRFDLDKVNVIGKLGTTPQERGLTTQQFKDKFDEGPIALGEFVNETLIPEVEAHTAENATNAHKISNIEGLQTALNNKAVTQLFTATLDTSWSGSSAPFSKTISVTGILSTDTPFIDVVMSGTYATDEARQEAWGYIYRATTANDSITFYANEKPTVSLPIQIKVVR